MSMNIIELVETNYSSIDGAAIAFLGRLYGDNITKDISLSSEVCGLMLLRASQVNISELSPGSVVLGAVSDETYDLLQRFLFSWAVSQGLALPDSEDVNIPPEASMYLHEAARFEKILLEICGQLGVIPE